MIKALRKYKAEGAKINKTIEHLPSDERSCISYNYQTKTATVCINFHKEDWDTIAIEAIQNYLNNNGTNG